MISLQNQSCGARWRFSHHALLLLLIALPVIVRSQNTDLFNYDGTRSWESGMDYGPKDWDQVECDDLEECVRAVLVVESIHLPPLLMFVLTL